MLCSPVPKGYRVACGRIRAISRSMTVQEWIKFEEEIELFKKSYKYENQKDNYYAINCDIFDDFCNNKTIKTLVDNFNLKCKRTWLIKIKRKSILEFSYNIIDDLINEILKEVLEYI